ncbi:expansin EXLX1 family cellulose-binding protein [Actinomadura rudentiformis]|uniref:RlpA-like protein double-psi beta-barrel domain-containing protein n=1 Tax=Actinomadura rudentiformis TaxID=359158 RepID=A0A6H9YW89_9ACTN|nr:expansin EXLX1 family cellulose-binding protein [Actinomadura rudentiformis]KAB2345118.1 hypothetical protein F8566_27975 [Actinomadura rudentiformis]
MHARPPRRPGFRWIWAPLVGIVVFSLTVGVIRLQETACAAVAAPPAPDTGPAPLSARWGTAAYHRDWSEVLCSLGDLSPSGYYVSLSEEEFGRASLCGSYLEVAGPEGVVRVQVVDRCRACAPGRLDLSERAFSRIGDRREGVVQVRYRLVHDPRPVPRLAVRVKPGSTRIWLALLVLGHGNPISRVELRAAGRDWRAMRRGVDNHWVISAPGDGPYRVRVTDRFGNRAVLRWVAFETAAVQHSEVRLYGTFRRPGNSALPSARLPDSGPATSPAPFKVTSLCS